MTSKFSYFAMGMSLGVATGLLFAPRAGVQARTSDESKPELKFRVAGAGEPAYDPAEGWVEPYGDGP